MVEYSPNAEPITQETFVEWTKEIFNMPDSQRPPKLMAFRQEDYDYFIKNGVPAESIIIYYPTRHHKKDKPTPLDSH